MRAQLTTAVTGMTKPTGWHYHVCEGQFVYTLKGWVELEFEDGRELPARSRRVRAPSRAAWRTTRSGTSDDLEIP